jgi:hypothetical protein
VANLESYHFLQETPEGLSIGEPQAIPGLSFSGLFFG